MINTNFINKNDKNFSILAYYEDRSKIKDLSILFSNSYLLLIHTKFLIFLYIFIRENFKSLFSTLLSD